MRSERRMRTCTLPSSLSQEGIWVKSSLREARCFAVVRARVVDLEVLHFFFELDPKPIAHAALELADQFPDLEGRAAAMIVNKIGVIGCNTNTAVDHALGAGQLQEVGGGHFALANHALRNSRLHGRGQIDTDQVLEDTAGATHAGR